MNEDREKILFSSLVLMFHAAGMQQLGKVKNPITDNIERDLEQAQMSIDMLDMLAAKTKGHLAPEEEQLLKTMTQELKLNYVDEASKEGSQKKEVPNESQS
jgi:hypothetical protein